jgi:Fe-S oxidoreductase
MFMEETGKRRVNNERATELAATGAKVAAVGCPFCATMLSDGMRATGASTEVRDIAVQPLPDSQTRRADDPRATRA